MADAGSDLVASFMAITGADDDTAMQMLEAANFSLEDAVNLFFAAEGNVNGTRSAAGGNAAAGGGAGGPGRAEPGGIGAERGGSAGPPDLRDDEVRAPLPTKVERLYDFDPRAMYQYHGLSGRAPPQSTHVDVFRDFKAESQAAGAAGAAGAGGSASASVDAAAGGSQGLSGLFKLPADLVFSGNVDLAKARAATEGKWLLLNVQSNTEFASHRLNRDTWSHEALKEVLKGTFVFYQTHESSTDGRALIKAYRLEQLAAGSTPLPAILVVDPITGAQLWHRAGFIDAEKLMEELVPFMDHGPLDAGAVSLAQNTMKRKPPTGAAAPSAAAASSAKPMTEDEELALAIAMSMERGGAGTGGAAGDAMEEDGAGDAGGLDDLDEAAIWEQIQAAERQAAAAKAGTAAAAKAAPAPQPSKKSPEEVAAEAQARVPPEPAEGDPDSLRLALRLPDGTRLARRFRKTDPVRVLLDLGLTHVPEAAAGRSLVISHAMPGGQVLSDPDQTLDAAGVAGAMLAVKLAD